jgi:hypothetical protein
MRIMTDDVLTQMRRIQADAMGLQRQVERANGNVPLRGHRGIDPTGAVEVVLGTDGLPASIDVEDDWTRKVRPERLVRAVHDAFSVALQNRLRAWTSAFDDASEGADPTPADAASSLTTDVRPPDPEAFARAVVEALDSLGDLSQPPPDIQGVGTVARGNLTVTLDAAGRLSCTAEPMWLSQRTGPELTEAFSTALAAAKDDLAQAPSSIGRLQHLLNEGLAYLGGGGGRVPEGTTR